MTRGGQYVSLICPAPAGMADVEIKCARIKNLQGQSSAQNRMKEIIMDVRCRATGE